MKPQTTINSTFKAVSTLMIVCILFLNSACQEPIVGPEVDDPIIVTPEVSFIAGPEGGYFKALDGNVELFFPESALLKDVAFLLDKGPMEKQGDFVIHSIVIKPKHLGFLEPVSIRLRYNGCLANGKDPCKAKCLVLYYFEDDKAFDMRAPKDMVCIEQCSLNTMDRCIETKIQRTGVYAIGEASLDPTNN